MAFMSFLYDIIHFPCNKHTQVDLLPTYCTSSIKITPTCFGRNMLPSSLGGGLEYILNTGHIQLKYNIYVGKWENIK